MDLDEFRATIPAATEATYLNTGSSSPSSVDVVESMQAFLEHHGYESPTAEGMYQPVYEAFDETRRDVADFLNAHPEAIALTQSTGDGVSRIANAIQWNSGDTVVEPTSNIPLPSSLERPRTRTRSEPVLETDAGHVDLDRLKDAVAGARLVCVSSISRKYGRRHPVSGRESVPATVNSCPEKRRCSDAGERPRAERDSAQKLDHLQTENQAPSEFV